MPGLGLGLGLTRNLRRGALASTLTAVASSSPTFGPTGGGTSIVVEGTGLDTVTSATVGAVAATITAQTSTTLTLTVPALSQGLHAIAVTGPGGTATLAAAWRSVPLIVWFRHLFGQTNSAGFCSAWADQSGNGRNATQGSAGARPQIVAAGLLFDGGDQLDLADIAPPAALTIISAARQTLASSGNYVLCQWDFTGNERALWHGRDGGTGRLRTNLSSSGTAATSGADGTIDHRGSWVIGGSRWSGGTAVTLRNGRTVAATSAGSTASLFNATDGWSIGSNAAGIASGQWVGEIAEIVAASVSLSDDEVTWLASDINRRAGLGLTIT